MRAYLPFACLIMSITLLDGRLPAGGLPWNFLNALGFCGLAALVCLGWDPITLEYLKLKAPWYMHAGLVSFLCVLVLAISSFPAPRRCIYRRFALFRGRHLTLSITATPARVASIGHAEAQPVAACIDEVVVVRDAVDLLVVLVVHVGEVNRQHGTGR